MLELERGSNMQRPGSLEADLLFLLFVSRAKARLRYFCPEAPRGKELTNLALLFSSGIPHKLYLKSVLTDGCRVTHINTVTNFIKRNQIDVLVPSDVTDTLFVAKHHAELTATGVKFAVTPNPSLYETLEDKWETYNFCTKHNIVTPITEKFDPSLERQAYPFFLKVASGTNAGRGVWHCKNDDDLKDALKDKETRGNNVLLLRQTPTYGEVICAEVLYSHGFPIGFFFAKSVQADDLAGMGTGELRFW